MRTLTSAEAQHIAEVSGCVTPAYVQANFVTTKDMTDEEIFERDLLNERW